ncbi:hypothetical protein HanXRQr2_Chr10g0456381 [Helianthus annuus]|uniref:Uncharacterized protein n=1 Tax=Helianthus annuus TaxID=4232 RepID=A0A9K3I096_HELAN|nr:uncharacterized protein LOC118483201 [Helianthus annuus]KAF5787751.1 hypothetical protein HanXRQr2_Chr10g0456381 [Helianthus annuus]KAJ0697951.1 putative Glycosyl-transferase [Helianthus annuus]
MLDRGVQVFSAKGQEAINTALKADLVILNTAVAGKWLDVVLAKNVPRVLPKVLWWIHEMRGHYFKLDYIKYLPYVAGSMIDSHVTAEYWENRTNGGFEWMVCRSEMFKRKGFGRREREKKFADVE